MKRKLGRTVIAYGICAALVSGFLCEGAGTGIVPVQAAEITTPNETEQVSKTDPFEKQGLTTASEIAIDETNFPDEYLREYVKQNCDTDGNGVLSIGEQQNVTYINITDKPVKDLTGISYFTDLSNITIQGALLRSVDLSIFQKLTYADFSRNKNLEHIDLTGCTTLTDLNFSDCKVSGIDLQDCMDLQRLYCGNNQLTELNVSGNLALEDLYCYNDQLTSLNIQANKSLSNLDCRSNKLIELDISQNINLKSLNCESNQLKRLDISHNTALTSLCISYNYITSLDVSKNHLLNVYGSAGPCWYTDITDGLVQELEDGSWLLDLSGQDGSIPEKYTIVDWMDTTNLPELTQQGVVWKKNPVSDLSWMQIILDYDLSNGYYLDGMTLRCSYDLKRENLIYNEPYIALTEENFPDEKFRNFLIENFDQDGDGKFQPGTIDDLYISEKDIKDLTGIAHFTHLSTLDCRNNKLTKLDISANQMLRSLDCDNNSILGFDLTQNACLEYVNIGTQSLDLTVNKTEEEKYRASSETLRTVMGSIDILSNKESILSDSVKLADGFEWTTDPMKGAYVVTENIYSIPFTTGNTNYQGTYGLKLNFYNGYDRFDPTKIEIDETNFPDKAFRDHLMCYHDNDGDGQIQPYLITHLDLRYMPELENLKGIEYFTSLTELNLQDDPALKEIDLSQNVDLTYLNVGGTQIHRLDLQNNPKIQRLDIWNAPLTAIYLAEDSENISLPNTTIKTKATAENGRYVLDLSAYGGYDAGRIIGLTDGDVDGDKIYWSSQDEIPRTFTYKFLLRSDHEAGKEYTDTDFFTVQFMLSNNEPEMPDGKILKLDPSNFPSAQLLQYLKDNFDHDRDGRLNTADVDHIYLGDQRVTDLRGIEHLDHLQSLSIYNGAFTKLDVSNNTVLTSLACTNGSMTNIDISRCAYLETVDLSHNSLAQVDVSHNKMLRSLSVAGNSLTELDIKNNTKLKDLNVDYNAIYNLDLTKNTRLQSLKCSGNPRMTKLDLTQNKNLKTLNCCTNETMEQLEFPEETAQMQSLSIAGNSIQSLSIDKMPYLTYLNVDSNKGYLNEIDLAGNTRLQYLTTTGLTLQVDWPNMTALKNLTLNNTPSTWDKMDLSNATELENVSIYSVNTLTGASFHGCGRLAYLRIDNSSLQQIDLTDCTALSSLDLRNNEISSLDLRTCTALKTLDLSYNKLDTLDITENKALQDIYCQYNKLSTIDTSKNAALKWFDCSGNPIVSLDLSQNKAMLTNLNCMGTSLTSLDVKENTVLENVELKGQKFVASEKDLQIGTLPKISQKDDTAEIRVRGVDTEKCILHLDNYGNFDPNKVYGLTSGTATANGIEWASEDEIPDIVTYNYDISNDHKLKMKNMPVTIILKENTTLGPTAKPETKPSPDKIPTTKRQQKIICPKTIKKTYGNRPFSLNARTTGDGMLTYTNHSKSVARVSTHGKVVLTGAGLAVITIKAAATQKHYAATIKVIIKVNPAKQSIKTPKVKKGRKLTLRWKKDMRATGYQIQYSTDKRFKKGVTVKKVNDPNTRSATYKKLKAGKVYYTRVRAYKTSGKSILYGAWSDTGKTKKIKK